MLKNTVLIKHA